MTEEPSEHPSTDASAPDDVAPEVVDLSALARDLTSRAREDPHGRASHIVLRGPRQRGVVMALTAGSALGEHASPPAASLHVFSGSVRLHSVSQEWVVGAGELISIPSDRHAVEALEESVFLLTVTLDPPPGAGA